MGRIHIDENNGNTFGASAGEWVEPALGSSRCDPNDTMGSWTGLGGLTDARNHIYQIYIEQDGTAERWPGISQDEGWFADNSGYPYLANIWATDGEYFWSDVTNTGGGNFVYDLENIHTGAFVSYGLSTSTYTLQTAETIVERANGTSGAIANFGTQVSYGTFQYPGNSTWMAINSAPTYVKNYMGTSTWVLVTPSGLYGGVEFLLTQDSCN